MLKQILENLNEGDSSTVKKMIKLLKKKGQIEIVIGDTDTWAVIDDIEDGIGYGINQFDDDFEIDLDKDNYTVEND